MRVKTRKVKVKVKVRGWRMRYATTVLREIAQTNVLQEDAVLLRRRTLISADKNRKVKRQQNTALCSVTAIRRSAAAGSAQIIKPDYTNSHDTVNYTVKVREQKMCMTSTPPEINQRHH